MNRVLHFTRRVRIPGERSWDLPTYEERFYIAEEVGDTGYYVTGDCDDQGTTWQVVAQDGKQVGNMLNVSMPAYDDYSSTMKPARIAFTQHLASHTGAEASLVYACGEMMKLAAAYAEHLTQAYEEIFKQRIEAARKEREELARKRAEREAEYQRIREERQAARRAYLEKRQAFIATRVEELQWYLDQPMRLRRHGKKSVVMGKVNDISESGLMRITSERGAALRTYVDALEYFEIKYEGDRSYTEIDLSPPPDDVDLRTG